MYNPKIENPFIIVSNRIKYLEIILTNVLDLYTKIYRTCLKEIKDEYKWKDIQCLRIKVNIIKMAILPKLIRD